LSTTPTPFLHRSPFRFRRPRPAWAAPLSVGIVLSVLLLSGSSADARSAGWGDRGVVKLPGVAASGLLDDGQAGVVVLGLANQSRAVALRLRPDGSPDRSFGVGGRVLWPYSRFLGWTMGAVTPSGNILLVGATRFGTADVESQLVLTELDARGELVHGFGTNGEFASKHGACIRGPAAWHSTAAGSSSRPCTSAT
jgi:hypothetical protein